MPTIDFVNMTTDQDKDVSILEEDNSQIYAYISRRYISVICSYTAMACDVFTYHSNDCFPVEILKNYASNAHSILTD